MKLRILAFFAIFLLVNSWAQAQVTIPYTFTSGTTASSSQVNANFTALGNSSLNRTGGNLTGNITAEAGVTIDGIDLSATLGSGVFTGNRATLVSTTTPQLHLGYDGSNDLDVSVSSTGAVTFDATGSGAAFTFSDNVTIPTLTLTTLSCTGCVDSTDLAADSVGASQLVATGVSAGSYGSATALATFTVDADGRLTAAGTTAISESGITDGSILARVASNETVTGAWTFGSGLTLNSSLDLPQVTWLSPGAGTNEKRWLGIVISGAWQLRAYEDSGNTSNLAVSFGRSGLTMGPATWGVTQQLMTDGSGSAPAYSFASDTNTGMFRNGADQLTFAVGGSSRLLIDNTDTYVQIGGNLRPDINNSRQLGSSSLKWANVHAVAGTFTGALSSATLSVSGSIQFPDGAVGAPGMAFTDDPDTGFYRTANTLAAAFGGQSLWISGKLSTDAGYLSLASGSAVLAGTGNVSGARLFIPNNGSGNGAAGCLQLSDATGGIHSLWVDATGDLRIGTAGCPQEDNNPSDTGGTVVGAQS